MNVYDWVWQQKYLDRPRAERWTAFADAKAQGHSFKQSILMDALGLDGEALVGMFRHHPDPGKAAAAEAKRLGVWIDHVAIASALRQRSF